MDVHRHLLRYYRGAIYCLLGAVILTGCDITITIQRRERPAPEASDTAAAPEGETAAPKKQRKDKEIGRPIRPTTTAQGDCIVEAARGFIGIQEQGANRGAGVEAIQAEAGIPRGAPWCQAMVLVAHKRCGVVHSMDGRAVSACPPNKVVKEARPGDVICISWNGNRIDHSGIVEKDEGQRYVTIEGNTSDPQKVRAEGVYRKFRSKSLKHELGRW
jgi:hypothetical protein